MSEIKSEKNNGNSHSSEANTATIAASIDAATASASASSFANDEVIDREFNSLIAQFFDEPILFSSSSLLQSNESSGNNPALASSLNFNSLATNSYAMGSMTAPSSSNILIVQASKTNDSSQYNSMASSLASSSPSNGGRDVISQDGTDHNSSKQRKTGIRTKSSINSTQKRMAEEKEKLMRENSQLRDEIQRLRNQLQALPVTEDPGMIENELLRKSLAEHKRFIHSCLGMSLPSERVALRTLGMQGADFAFNHILNIVASSQNGKDWKPVLFSRYRFSKLKPGTDFTMCYRMRADEKGRKIFDFRIDIVSPKLDAFDIGDAMWKFGTKKEDLLKIFGSNNPCDYLCTFTGDGEKNHAIEGEKGEEDYVEKVEFHIYREHYPQPSPPFDCALITAKATKDLAVSTLWSRPEFTPLSAIIRDQYTPKIKEVNSRIRKYSRRAPTASTNRSVKVGDVQCNMVVATATQYTTTNESQGVVGPVPHFIKSHTISGMINWNDEAQLKVSKPIIGEDGKESILHTRESVPAARSVFILSLFDESFCVQSFKGFQSLISNNGELSPQSGFIMELLCKMVIDEIKEQRKKRIEEGSFSEEESSSTSSANSLKRDRPKEEI